MNFYYLTGIKTLNAVLVIDGKSGKSTIYRSVSRRGEPEAAPAGLEAKTSEDLVKDLPKLVSANPTIWMEMNQLKMLDQAGFGIIGSTGNSFGIQAASGPNSTSVHY